MVNHQYHTTMANMDEKEMSNVIEGRRNTKVDTRNASAEHCYQVKGTGMELSVETKTVVHTGEEHSAEVSK